MKQDGSEQEEALDKNTENMLRRLSIDALKARKKAAKEEVQYAKS